MTMVLQSRRVGHSDQDAGPGPGWALVVGSLLSVSGFWVPLSIALWWLLR